METERDLTARELMMTIISGFKLGKQFRDDCELDKPFTDKELEEESVYQVNIGCHSCYTILRKVYRRHVVTERLLLETMSGIQTTIEAYVDTDTPITSDTFLSILKTITVMLRLDNIYGKRKELVGLMELLESVYKTDYPF